MGEYLNIAAASTVRSHLGAHLEWIRELLKEGTASAPSTHCAVLIRRGGQA